jgi:hypothetical protein
MMSTAEPSLSASAAEKLKFPSPTNNSFCSALYGMITTVFRLPAFRFISCSCFFVSTFAAAGGGRCLNHFTADCRLVHRENMGESICDLYHYEKAKGDVGWSDGMSSRCVWLDEQVHRTGCMRVVFTMVVSKSYITRFQIRSSTVCTHACNILECAYTGVAG